MFAQKLNMNICERMLSIVFFSTVNVPTMSHSKIISPKNPVVM